MPGLTAPDAATPDGFRRAVETLAGHVLQTDARLALAVSGGPDSLAMLWLGARAFGRRAIVLTVDHGLRAEAAAEAAAVCAHAAEMGLDSEVLSVTVKPTGAGLQADARAARYAALGAWCRGQSVRTLLTAHHAEDQAETLLMRLARGSGVAGLAGIRAARPLCADVWLLRPLLDVRKNALASVVAQAGWTAATDPANTDPRHDRTRARALLANATWLRAEALAASAAELAEAEAALAWAEKRAWVSRVSSGPDAILIDAE
ncbi:MAG: tRNA lysidine(34) synthetase TilS, partial [Thermaurantiacus sp.]